MAALRLTGAAIAATVLLMLTGCVEPPTITEKPAAASDAAASADVASAKLAIISYLSLNGKLPTAASELTEWGYHTSADVSVVVIHPGANNHFCVDAVAKTGNVFKATDTVGAATGACTSADLG